MKGSRLIPEGWAWKKVLNYFVFMINSLSCFDTLPVFSRIGDVPKSCVLEEWTKSRPCVATSDSPP